jgi:hypothetical protein
MAADRVCRDRARSPFCRTRSGRRRYGAPVPTARTLATGVLVLICALTGCTMPADGTANAESDAQQNSPATHRPRFHRPVKPLPTPGKPFYWTGGFNRFMTECEHSYAVGDVGALRISTPPGLRNYFVELRLPTQLTSSVTWGTVGVAVLPGRTVTIDVPLCGRTPANYELYYSVGTKWYGHRYRFGPEGLYSHAGDTFRFHRGTEWNVELILRPGGNLSTSGMDYNDFVE